MSGNPVIDNDRGLAKLDNIVAQHLTASHVAPMYSSLVTVLHERYRPKSAAFAFGHAQAFCSKNVMLHKCILV